MEKNKKNIKRNNQKPLPKKGASKSTKEKERKTNRQKQQPISGFSTLSQVSGAPLYKAHKSNIPIPNETTVMEPNPVCPRCGQSVNEIASAFFIENQYVHFDCILNEIKEGEKLGENQTISYLGSGAFGICEKGEDNKYTIIKRIEVENKDSIHAMKEYIGTLKK